MSSKDKNLQKTSKPVAEIIRVADYRVMEWKNGKGKTEEIAIEPTGANFSVEPFLWRLSSARMTVGGPFSSFPGYDRFLAVTGAGQLKLRFAGSGREVDLRKGDALKFSGDEAVESELIGPSSKDLNLIFKRDQVGVQFDWAEIGKKPRSFRVGGKTSFVYVTSGKLTASVYPGELKFKLGEGETLRLNPSVVVAGAECLVLLEPLGTSCSLILIELS